MALWMAGDGTSAGWDGFGRRYPAPGSVTGSCSSRSGPVRFDNTIPNPAPTRGPGSAGSRGRCLPVLRAYELMIIIDSDVGTADVDSVIAQVADLVTGEGGTIVSTDNWGRRKFAYKINHKTEGTYVVWEIVTANAGLPDTERRLRLADDIVRHKLFRLPDDEAERRSLFREAVPASRPAEIRRFLQWDSTTP